MWVHFIEIFTGQMAWLTITLIAIGIVFCIIEAVVPGFGIFGILGILCEIGSIVVHAVFSNSPIGVLILFSMITLIMLLIFLLFIRSAKYGLIGRTPIIEKRTAVPRDYIEKSEKELKPLIGKEGITVTECKPGGKVRIGDGIYEAYSKGTMIPKGEIVKIIAVEDTYIFINRVTY